MKNARVFYPLLLLILPLIGMCITKEVNWSAIDDNGEHPELAKSFIEISLKELLENKEPSNPETNSFGCRIYYRK